MAGVHVSRATKFCTVVPDIISIIITYAQKYVSVFIQGAESDTEQ